MMSALFLKGWCNWSLTLSMLAVLRSLSYGYPVEGRDYYREDQLNREHDLHIPESAQHALERHQLQGSNRSGKSVFRKAPKTSTERSKQDTEGSETKAGTFQCSSALLQLSFFVFFQNIYQKDVLVFSNPHWPFCQR